MAHLASLLLVAVMIGSTLAKSCIDCICEHESQCKPIGCNQDMGSLSCGYFQIKLPYYQDCGEPGKKPGESTEVAWKRCSDDYNCALSCVNSYFARYRSLCANKGFGECEQRSRIHNGGPFGCDAPRTDVYADFVKKCCGCA